MRVITSKSKNSESFYISKGYVNNKGVSTSVIVRKLGTLKDLLPEHDPTRDDVMKWAREEARLETIKYKKEQQTKSVQITFHADHKLDYDQQVFYRGGYLFPQTFYYRLHLDKTCRKLRDKHKFKYDINAILSDLIYARILEPVSKRSSFKVASEFLEKPSYQLHDIYRALDVLGTECDLIQSEVYKNSHLLGKRNDKILYYDYSNYYFEIEQEDGEIAKIENYLDTDKIENEALYDGLYAVTTDLLDDDVKDILKVSEGRWEIEECFRIMKTDFEARPIYLQDEIRIKAHFLICFLALVIYRYMEKSLGNAYTCEMILDKLKTMNFADVQEQGFIPLYTRDKLPYFKTRAKYLATSKMLGLRGILVYSTVKDRIIYSLYSFF